MTAAERAFLASRAAREASAGRILIGVHLILAAILLAVGFSGGPGRARGAFFVAGLVVVSGLGWKIYARLLSRWIREDLDTGQIALCRTRLVRKRLGQRKTGDAHCLYLDPPLPKKKIIVNAAAYASVNEGDRLSIRYFPASKVLMRVERTEERMAK